MRNKIVVLRGDVVGSRMLEDKALFWKKLDSVISRINKEFSEVLLYKIEISNGDEITGVCTRVRDSFIISSRLIEYLYPFKIRIVISEGKIDQQRKTRKLGELDGEVFWFASEEMKKLKKSKRLFSFFLSRREHRRITSSLANLLSELKYEWTNKEKEIIQLYDALRNQIQVAQRLNISQQSVSDGLRRAKYKIIREAEQS
ncbi:MAG: SatD family protein, partial [Candidatus Heimdallarchaeaceae archaeon]